MRALHHALMGITMIAVLTLAAGFLLPGGEVAIAQHGHGNAEAQEHFDAFVEQLHLTDDQRAAIAPSFGRAYGLMAEMRQLHETIAAELTEEQRAEFGTMAHEMMCGSMAEEMHGTGMHEEGLHEQMHGEGHH